MDPRLDDWIEGAYRGVRLYGHAVRVRGALKTAGAKNISIFSRYVGPEEDGGRVTIVAERILGIPAITSQADPGQKFVHAERPGPAGGSGELCLRGHRRA